MHEAALSRTAADDLLASIEREGSLTKKGAGW
jgi:hypothetical protein